MNYFLAPRSGEKSYQNAMSTIRHGVPYSKIEQFLSDEGKKLLLKEEIVYAWGNRQGTSAAWKRMQNGDVVIFYAHKRLIMTGDVYYKQQSKDLALAMWPPDEKGNPWEYTFFIKNLRYISIPIEEFNGLVQYKVNNVVQGFTELQPFRLQFISDKYGSVEKYFDLFRVPVSEELPDVKDKVYLNVSEDIVPVMVFDPLVGRPIKDSQLARVSDSASPKMKKDYIKAAENNAFVGSKGEELVLRQEKKNLLAKNLPDLASRVKRVSEEDDSKGYDILSFSDDGAEKYIEVKTTTGFSKNIRFFLSAREYAFAQSKKKYFVYYVEDIHKKSPKISVFSNPFFTYNFLISPDTYLVTAIKL